jgi:transposase
MLSESDYQEAVRRYKNMRRNGHERRRCHALIWVHQGDSYREVARILLVDEETISRWGRQYQERGLAGLENDPPWGGEHGQRELSVEQVAALQRILREEAMPGTLEGSGWTNKAVRQLLAERFGAHYSKSGVRKLFAHMGWSYQRGCKLYSRRDPVDQARYKWETQTVATPESDWAATDRGGRGAAKAGGESLWGSTFRNRGRSGPLFH